MLEFKIVFRMDDMSHITFTHLGPAHLEGGFWVDYRYEMVEYDEGVYWIPLHQILYVQKLER